MINPAVPPLTLSLGIWKVWNVLKSAFLRPVLLDNRASVFGAGHWLTVLMCVEQC